MGTLVISHTKEWRRSKVLWRILSVIIVVAVLIAVQSAPVLALFTNGGFESGDFSNWTRSSFLNNGLNCTTGGNCITRAAGGNDLTNVVGNASAQPMSLVDANSTIRFPRFGNYSAVVNYMGSNYNANSLKQTTTVTEEDVDVDGKVHVRFAYAPVLENPGHSPVDQPYFYIGLKNITKGGQMLYDKFAFSGQAGVPWQGTYVLYTDWQIVDIAPGAGLLDVGDTIELEVIAAGCSASGHYGYVYVDAFGAFIPGLSISASGPVSVSRTQDITYTYNWANTGNIAIDNVVLTSVAPAFTTYVSNDSGCTHNSGTVTCNLGTRAPGASGTVNITYNVGMGASGSVNHGNYSIQGTGFAAIIGPLVTTTVNPDFPPSAFTSGAPAGGTYGAPYSHDFDANGVPAPTYSLFSGTLPPGLALNPSSGVLSGTPSAAGNYSFTIRATNLLGSFNQLYSITIAPAGTTTGVTRSVASPVYSQPLYLTATVSPVAPSTYTPAGQVQFYVDGSPFGSPVSLSSGTAVSQATTSLNAGAHIYYAVYLGSANNNGSNSLPAGSVTVAPASTTTGVTRSVASPVYGQPLSLTATVGQVAPATTTPTGQVQFYVDGAPFGAPVTLSGGTAVSQTTVSLDAGSHTYSAAFLATANHNASDSLPASPVTIDQNSTTTGVVSSAATSVYGQPIRLTATVAENSPSVVTPVGQVQFFLDGSPLGAPVSLNESGQATSADLHTLLPGGHLLVGSYTFSAQYLGNSNSLGSTSVNSTQTVNRAPTTLVVNSSENPTVYGTSLQMTIKVTADSPSITIPAGQVQLSIDGVLFGTPLALNASGEAARTVPYLNLWPGTHAITAVYTPAEPAQYFGSNNNALPLSQVVNKANPIFTITPSAASPVATQPVSYSVVVGPSMITQGTPSGSVRFFVDGVALGDAVTLDAAGKANSPLSIELTAGPHDITVSYSGDDYFLTIPTSPALEQDVAKAGAAARITSIDPAASVVGQSVTVNVQVDPVTPATDSPAGTVTVSNGTDTCEITLNAAGGGSCQLEPTSPGSPDLTASYSGSANFLSDESDPFAGPVVSKADSVVGITGFDPAAPVSGQPVTVFFSVAPVAPGWGTPTGLVTISDGSGHSCSAPVAAGSCQITFDEAGPTSLSASYAGDANFNPFASTPAAGPTVLKASTSLALVSSAAPSVYGQPISMTATISVSAPGAGMPTGKVQFTIDGVNFGAPVDLSGGSAVSPEIANLSVATHSLGAVYLGDANFASATAPAASQVVNKADTTLVLTSNINPSPYGLSVLITASLTGNSPSIAIPTGGAVQFTVDGVNYGAPVPLGSDGKASKLLPYTALWVGTHTITAVYSGNDSFNGSNNLPSPFLQVVEKGILVITITPSVENPVLGQPFGFTAGVVGDGSNNPKPTGTVQFTVGGVNLGSPVTLDSASQAVSELIASLGVGPHTVGLVYSGDDYYKPTTVSIPSGVIIGKASITAAITGFDPAAPVVGQPVTVDFSTAVAAPGAGTPGGFITISNGVDSCTAAITAGSCELTPTTAGSTQLTLTYSGDANFNALGPTPAQPGPQVGPASVTVTITGTSAGPVVVGQPYTIYAQVEPAAPGTLIPAGMTVTLGNGSSTCTATVQADGSASCSITPWSAGEQILGASFEGGANFNDATAAPTAGPTVGPASTSTTLTSSINPVVEGGAVRFSVNVLVSSPGSGTPTGKVQFMIDGEPYGAPVDLVSGAAASPEVTVLTLGLHSVSAVYLGSGDYTTSTSAALSQKIVEGSLGSVITPSTGATLVYTGMQNGLPVTTTIDIPAGAVDKDVTLVFHQFNNSLLTPPVGMNFVANFTIDAYIDGVLQPSLAFLKPVTFTMTYNPKDWKESSLTVLGWDGSQWSADGLEVTQRSADLDTIAFTLDGTGALEFTLAGTHEYIYWMPVMGKTVP